MPHCKIRLQRFGKPHRPFYRIVATHRNFKRDGKHFERLGTWDPIPDRYGNKHIQLKSDRIHHWLSVGAEPSERVAWLLSRAELTPPAPLPPDVLSMLHQGQPPQSTAYPPTSIS